MIRLGVDVGGTFTDVVALDERTGSASWLKVLTDKRAPAEGALQAVRASGASLQDVAHLRLGTTLAVNAVLTRGGARTGLITTEGFRDVLEIRRTHRTGLFDLDERIPEPLVPRDLRMEVRERIDAAGEVVTSLDEDGVLAAWRALRAAGVSSVAIVFLFSFENPAHERRARELVIEDGGAELVLISSEVLPMQREYERTSTTAMAAYVAPAVSRHLSELDVRLQAHGLREGRLTVMTGTGGAVAADTLARNPISSLLSGPAAGVAAARRLAHELSIPNAITLDMGGTSCDVCSIVASVPDERLQGDVGGLAVAQPALDVHTIGAGGGSIAWIDSGGVLRVGPQSAGSHPGPACYGLGGQEPTVTDANLVLGRYEAQIPLGGTLRMDPVLARKAIEQRIAAPLGLSVEQVAAGIVRIAVALMASAVRSISVERGRDLRDFTLVAFGGAGPVHGAEVARELGVPRVLVPPCPGCTSALGAASAGYRYDFMRTLAMGVAALDPSRLASAVRELESQAHVALSREGFSRERSRLELWLDMRYEGQAHELSVRCSPDNETGALRPETDALEGGNVEAGDLEVGGLEVGGLEVGDDALAAAVGEFHDMHERLYGHCFDDVAVELVNVRVSAHGVSPLPEIRWRWPQLGRACATHTRPVYFDECGEFVEAAVLAREQIVPGTTIAGPAVVHQTDSTILIPPKTLARAHASGSLTIEADERS